MYTDPINNFLKTGLLELSDLFDKKKIEKLYQDLTLSRKIDESLFITERKYKINIKINYFLEKYFKFFVNFKKKYFPQTKHPEPFRKGKNFLNNYNLDFIENNKGFKELFETILGKNYEIILKKIVISISDDNLPEWIKKEIKNRNIKALSDFVKKKYRDVTYFNGIDFHQDYIDFHNKDLNFITGYIYLNDVNQNMAPLVVIENSHKLLATSFPHNLEFNKENKTFDYYSDINDEKLKNLKYKKLTGFANKLYAWTAYTLHGTNKQTDLQNRYSLRFLIKSNSIDKNLPINKILNLNNKEKLFRSLKSTRNNYKRKNSIELV